MTINPFEFLGLNPHKSTMADLRHAYYEIAKIVHPDRSGTDGSDMHILHMAYLYCKEQLENTARRACTFENLEHQFETFCKSQTEAPPSFRDIMEDALELQKFHAAFDESQIERGAYEKGYGELMEPSQYHSEAAVLPEITYNTEKIDTPKLSHNFQSLIIYKDPISFNDVPSSCLHRDTQTIDNFTTKIGNIILSDYCEANTIPQIPDVEIKPRTLEDIIKEREQDIAYSYYT